MKRLEMKRLASKRGFTLLEVMVAVAILGLTLTVILSAQGGLAASNKSANLMGLATGVGRCKMTELEEKLLKLGYPEIDDLQTDVSCCDDKDNPPFTCDTRVEKVVLPNPPDNSISDGGSPLSLSGPAASGSGGLGGALGGLPGPIGSIAAQALGPAGGAGLDLNGDGGLGGLGSALDKQMGPGGQGTAGLLTMVMGIVYPSVKVMMEASIRRLTVTIKWREGPNVKSLGLVQYVTNPQRGGFAGGVAGLDGGVGAPGPGGTGGGLQMNGTGAGGAGAAGVGGSPMSPFQAGGRN